MKNRIELIIGLLKECLDDDLEWNNVYDLVALLTTKCEQALDYALELQSIIDDLQE
tara:strand:+ start:310 stop:477 length:168 start_codon:yes stop_codon:yes gene_type:complete